MDAQPTGQGVKIAMTQTIQAPLLGGALRNWVDWHPEVLQNTVEVDPALWKLQQ